MHRIYYKVNSKINCIITDIEDEKDLIAILQYKHKTLDIIIIGKESYK